MRGLTRGRAGGSVVGWPLDVYLWRLALFTSRDRLRTSSPSSSIHSRTWPFPMLRAWASARGIETESMRRSAWQPEAVERYM